MSRERQAEERKRLRCSTTKDSSGDQRWLKTAPGRRTPPGTSNDSRLQAVISDYTSSTGFVHPFYDFLFTPCPGGGNQYRKLGRLSMSFDTARRYEHCRRLIFQDIANVLNLDN